MTDPGASEIVVGSVLQDTYEVTGILGRGGMGAVWAATHRRLPGKRVAIKVLLGELATRPEIYARFQREAEIASRLGHPNIVEVIDFNTLPSGTPYIVLEFLRGENLGDRIRRLGPISLQETIAILRQIASGLHAAHRAGVVHRDLKPDNIFLTPNDSDGVVVDRVKVLDFGISKIKDNAAVKTQTAAILGTPQYMAPEQAAGKQDLIDARTDQFALGAIVYEMLSGKPAFSGETLAEIVCKVMLEQPIPLAQVVPNLPPQVIAAVDRALSKDSTQRFADVASFVEAMSGKPLLTLDRPVVKDESQQAFAATMAGAVSQTQTPQPIVKTNSNAVPTAPPSRTGLVVGLALGGIAAIGIGAYALVGGAKPASVITPEPSPPAAASPSPSLKPVAVPDLAVASALDLATTPISSPSPSAATKKHNDHAVTAAPSEKLPTAALELIASAEAALKIGDTVAARDLVRKALLVKPAARIYALGARVECKSGNLERTRLMLHKVPAASQAAVFSYCKSVGLELE